MGQGQFRAVHYVATQGVIQFAAWLVQRSIGRPPVPVSWPWPSGNECLSKPRQPFGRADERELWTKGQ